jgi:hypothetical protein
LALARSQESRQALNAERVYIGRISSIAGDYRRDLCWRLELLNADLREYDQQTSKELTGRSDHEALFGAGQGD